MCDSDDNEENVRDVSKAGIDQMPTDAQMARRRNYCRYPEKIKLGPKVADFDVCQRIRLMCIHCLHYFSSYKTYILLTTSKFRKQNSVISNKILKMRIQPVGNSFSIRA